MKNNIKVLAIAFVFASTQIFAGNVEDKMKMASIEQALPETAPSIESPAPQRIVKATDYKTQTAAQKAATVELTFKNLEKGK